MKNSLTYVVVSACIIGMTAIIPSLPPDLAPFYGLAAAILIPAIIKGPKQHRILGILTFILATCLLGDQLYEARKMNKRIQQTREKYKKMNNENRSASFQNNTTIKAITAQ